MKMLKSLLIGALTLTMVAPTLVSAEDNNVSAPGDQTIQLSASRTSSYTVTLPKTLDVSQNTTTFDVTVQGDISGSETITITMADTTLTETVTTGTAHDPINVTVDFGTNKVQNYTHTDIVTANTKTATLTHETIPAGTWSGTLSVNIAVNGRQ